VTLSCWRGYVSGPTPPPLRFHVRCPMPDCCCQELAASLPPRVQLKPLGARQLSCWLPQLLQAPYLRCSQPTSVELLGGPEAVGRVLPAAPSASRASVAASHAPPILPGVGGCPKSGGQGAAALHAVAQTLTG